ncbi:MULTISPECIES: EAL domain-containing protein [Spirulina sp. CCY15215]|uniref:EAL domain-containing protein n=1 Tax=Spirulina sp. CCY15215 TaxID=2767591 RepID=UPI00194F6FA7
MKVIQPLRSLSRIIWVSSCSIVASSTVVTGLFWGLQELGAIEPLDLAVFDRFVQLQGDAPPDPRLLAIAITEEDLHRYGWPLSDAILAQTLQKLQSYQPRVIGLDLYRDIPKPPGEKALVKQLQAENIIAITEIVSNIPPPPPVENERVGFNDFALDRDGILRRNLLFVAGKERDYYSFALRVSLAYGRKEGISFRYNTRSLFLGETELVALQFNSGGYQTADTRGYQILMKYCSRSNIIESIGLKQFLEGDIPPEAVRDKIVLIGTVAPSLKDLILTPYSGARQKNAFQMSGVIVHAQMIRQLLGIISGENRQFSFWSQGSELLWLWVWALVGGICVWSLKHPLAFSLTGILGIGAIAGVGWLLLAHLVWIPIVEPALAFTVASGLAVTHRLLYTTTRDPFTGLLNRESLVSYIKRSLSKIRRRRLPSRLGVMFLQCDRLQLIQENWGKAIGDRFFLTLVKKMRKNIPHSAKLARVSESEFALVLNLPPEALTTLADRLQNILEEPFSIESKQIVTKVNIGIATTQERHLHTPENLLRDANTAMFRAKALGKTHSVFATGMFEEAVAQFALENELRQGITKEEFVLYYQPIVALKTGKIMGFEALIRWQHPDKGFISPFMFIPLAEETGLIIPLGEWIFQAACRQARQWQEEFGDRDLILSINLSGRQFEQPDLIEMLAKIIKDTGVGEHILKVEITESMVMDNVEKAIDLMLQIKSLGCKLSMDDFGTGYSSLSQLRRFPVDTLKVDKSFVQKMGESREDYEIVRMIINLGHILGMDIIAEGVETQEDAEKLSTLECEFGQGYLWAKPLPVEEATALLQGENARELTE